MDNLKSAIADKILAISSSDDIHIKSELERISRFKDFINACRSLIQKYPNIETELLKMVENNDFDTRIASSRVDAIIRISENETANKQPTQIIDEDINQLKQITVDFPKLNNNTSNSKSGYTDYEIVENSPIQNTTSEKETTLEISEKSSEDNFNTQQNFTEKQPSIQVQKSSAKSNAKKGLQLIIAIAIILILIFGIVFVIKNFTAILYFIGALLGIALIVWIILQIKKQRKNNRN